MNGIKYRLQKRRKAKEILYKLLRDPEHVLIIHYSCEDFYSDPKKSSRITSIAVRFLDTGQTKSFSIHKIAELKGISYKEISEHFNDIEKEMLDDFFKFVEEHRNDTWIHWNMRDINYGFEAIEHRYSVLGGTPIKIDNSKKVDLSRILIDIYGVKYIGPKIDKINRIKQNRKNKFLKWF